MKTLFLCLDIAYIIIFVTIMVIYARKIKTPQPPKFFFNMFTVSMLFATLEITAADFDPSKGGYPMPALFLLVLATSCVDRLYATAKTASAPSPKPELSESHS